MNPKTFQAGAQIHGQNAQQVAPSLTGHIAGLEMLVGELQDQLQALTEQLSPILSSDIPETGLASEAPARSEASANLAAFARRLNAVLANLRNLRTRIDL